MVKKLVVYIECNDETCGCCDLRDGDECMLSGNSFRNENVYPLQQTPDGDYLRTDWCKEHTKDE